MRRLLFLATFIVTGCVTPLAPAFTDEPQDVTRRVITKTSPHDTPNLDCVMIETTQTIEVNGQVFVEYVTVLVCP